MGGHSNTLSMFGKCTEKPNKIFFRSLTESRLNQYRRKYGSGNYVSEMKMCSCHLFPGKCEIGQIWFLSHDRLWSRCGFPHRVIVFISSEKTKSIVAVTVTVC